MVLSEYEIEPEVCNRDILELLHVLRASGLIEVRNEKSSLALLKVSMNLHFSR